MADLCRPDVAIVGGGPAGLGAAMELRERGAGHILVLEREPEAGGVVRHCGHPPFGMREFKRVLTGPEYARRLRSRAVDLGVDLRTGHSVVSIGPGGRLDVAANDGPLRIAARRVVLATGVRESPRSARLISGQRPVGVLNTGMLQGCVYLKNLKPFSRPVIVGSELVGLSAVWTCLRHGMRPMALVEEGDIGVRWPLGWLARLCGIPLHVRTRVARIDGDARVRGVELESAAGRVTTIACDGVLLTGRFIPEAALPRQGSLACDPGSGGPVIDQYGRCSDPAYFAAGNLLRPVETAGWCHREGRRIGGLVARDLEGGLAPARELIRIEAGRGVQFAVPQRIAGPGELAGLDALQVRASGRCNGRLTLRHGSQTLWSRRVRSRPEGRLLIPMRGFRLPPQATVLTVAIEAGG